MTIEVKMNYLAQGVVILSFTAPASFSYVDWQLKPSFMENLCQAPVVCASVTVALNCKLVVISIFVRCTSNTLCILYIHSGSLW